MTSNEPVLTRKRARDSFTSVQSTIEIRRQALAAAAERQQTIRDALTAAAITPDSVRLEIFMFNSLDHSPERALAFDLAWILRKLGSLIRKNMLRRHAAGERSVHHPIGPGLWSFVLTPFLIQLGSTVSLDCTTLGLTATMLNQLFLQVGIDLSSLRKNDRIIRIAPSEVCMISRKRQHLYLTFWCEIEMESGEFVLR